MPPCAAARPDSPPHRIRGYPTWELRSFYRLSSGGGFQFWSSALLMPVLYVQCILRLRCRAYREDISLL
jgi:hypothetical protein